MPPPGVSLTNHESEREGEGEGESVFRVPVCALPGVAELRPIDWHRARKLFKTIGEASLSLSHTHTHTLSLTHTLSHSHTFTHPQVLCCRRVFKDTASRSSHTLRLQTGCMCVRPSLSSTPATCRPWLRFRALSQAV